MSDKRRAAGISLIVVGVLAVAAAAFEYWRGTQTGIKLTTLGARAIDGINPAPLPGVPGDMPRIDVPDTPPPGRTLYVSSRTREPGDGTFEKPFGDLQAVLCSLEPGDRLLVMHGAYHGPFTIGGDCRDGTAQKPIEVYFSDDAVLEGADRDDPDEGEVLRLARSHWRLGGMEVHPEFTRVGVVIGPDVRHVTLEGAHIYSGVGSGIVIEPGSEDVTITNCHLHKLGSLGGRTRDEVHGAQAGIRIHPGTRRIAVLETKMHNILGPSVEVVPPEQYEANPGLPAAAELTIDDARFMSDQDEWW